MGRWSWLALVLGVGLAVGAAGWEVLERISVVPLGWLPDGGPASRAAAAGWEVASAGAGVVASAPAGPTLRAWAPSVRVSVTPRGERRVTVTLENIPARAGLVAPPWVTEQVSGTTRVVSGTAGARWEMRYERTGGDLRFAVVGDTGASDTFEEALRTAAGVGADFTVVVGDLAYTDGDVGRLRRLLARAPLAVYAIRGNHDYATGARRDFVQALTPPYFAFAFGGAAFVMLDTGREMLPGLGRDSDQHEWLQHTLASPMGSPVFVFMHKPPTAPAQEAVWHRMLDRSYARALVRDFEHAGVSMVFAGHLHRHLTWARNGVTYVVSGEGKVRPAAQPQMALVEVRAGEAAMHFVPIWAEAAR